VFEKLHTKPVVIVKVNEQFCSKLCRFKVKMIISSHLNMNVQWNGKQGSSNIEFMIPLDLRKLEETMISAFLNSAVINTPESYSRVLGVDCKLED
jgi:hypothetical protein